MREREWEGRRFKFFESARAVAVCGGVGPEAARRACHAAISLYRPELVVSAGFAGALSAKLRVGDVLRPASVVDAGDGSRTSIAGGVGILISAQEIASAGQKRKLAAAYGADAVDMEAAAVAKGAEGASAAFAAVKAISDEADFDVPVAPGAVDGQGRFHAWRFFVFVVVRPWLWSKVIRLARSSSVAARNLCRELETVILESAGP